MMLTILAVAAAVIILAVIIFALIWHIRARKFKPTTDKRLQLKNLNEVLEPSGFAYDPRGDFFYSLMNCWQREVGYCSLYDEGAPFFNMVMDCEPVTFAYGGKRWLIELWKGQYGITSGAEVGIYNTARGDINSEKFKGTFYENIQDDEMLRLSFVLRRNGKVLMRRRERHWWLTGFKLGIFSEPGALTMDVKIVFPNRAMRDAFVGGLRATGYQPGEFSVRRMSVVVHYTEPHAKQPDSQIGPQRVIAQGLNRTNCALYRSVTKPHRDTLDQLEFLQTMAPELFTFLLNSLYARGLFEAFEWIKNLFPDIRPVPPAPIPPVPPVPPIPPVSPDPPCPPDPPCSIDQPCSCGALSDTDEDAPRCEREGRNTAVSDSLNDLPERDAPSRSEARAESDVCSYVRGRSTRRRYRSCTCDESSEDNGRF